MAEDNGVIPKKKKKLEVVNKQYALANPIGTSTTSGIGVQASKAIPVTAENIYNPYAPANLSHTEQPTYDPLSRYIKNPSVGGIYAGDEAKIYAQKTLNENKPLFHNGVDFNELAKQKIEEAKNLTGIGYTPPADPNRMFYGVDTSRKIRDYQGTLVNSQGVREPAMVDTRQGAVQDAARQGHVFTDRDMIDLYGARDRTTMTPQEIEEENIKEATMLEKDRIDRENFYADLDYKEKERERQRAIELINTEKRALDYRYGIDSKNAQVGAKTPAEAILKQQAIDNKYKILYANIATPPELPVRRERLTPNYESLPEVAGFGVKKEQANIAKILGGIETPEERTAKLEEVRARTGEALRQTGAMPKTLEETYTMLGIKSGKDPEANLLLKMLEVAPESITDETGVSKKKWDKLLSLIGGTQRGLHGGVLKTFPTGQKYEEVTAVDGSIQYYDEKGEPFSIAGIKGQRKPLGDIF